MAEKKKLIKASSQNEESKDVKDWEYPDIDLDRAAKHLKQLEDGDPKFRKQMDKGRKLANKIMKGAKLIVMFLFVAFGLSKRM